MKSDDRKLGICVIGSGRAGMIHARNFARRVTRARLVALTDAHAPTLAEARAELGATGIYQTSTGAFTAAGCGSFTIGGSASQCFPTPCWDGSARATTP